MQSSIFPLPTSNKRHHHRHRHHRYHRHHHHITCMAIIDARISVRLATTQEWYILIRRVHLCLCFWQASALTGLIIVMEMFDSSKRAFAGIGLETFWVINYVLLPLMAYYLRDWRHLELTISAVVFVWIIFIWRVDHGPFPGVWRFLSTPV